MQITRETGECDGNTILLIFDLDTGAVSDEVKECAKEALRGSVEKSLKKHFADDAAVELIFSTADPNPRMQNSTECTVHHIRDNYIIRGDTSLSKDLQKKIGSQAKVFGNT